jgi:GTP-binding protein EngB required for normal cell division
MMSLRDYEAAKFELGDILRALAAHPQAARSGLLPPDEVSQLFARLAQDSFNLVVVGRFSRGKTSLMNAMLGLDRLPTGILPLTSVITSVAYSSREEVRIEFERGRYGYEIPMSQLAEFITERGNPGNIKHIVKARIGLPAELLRRGFCFVDTPGLGSAIAENARTTEAYLPEADALLMVSGYDGPLSEDELRVAVQLSALNRRLFFVLNKQDLVSAQERAQAQDYVRRQLAGSLQARVPPLYSVSARDALRARLDGDPALFAASGMEALEAAVTRFLIEDKSTEFLRGMCDRVQRLCEAIPVDTDLAALCGRLQALRRRIEPGNVEQAPAGPPRLWPAQRAAVMIADCPVCRRVGDALFDFLRRYQYELASSEAARARFASQGGFCAPHLRLYQSLAGDRDLCVALAPLVERVSAVLQEAGASPTGSAAAGAAAACAALQDTAAHCELCQLRDEVEQCACAELVAAAVSQEQPAALPSLCLPHLRLMQRNASDGAVARALLLRQSAAAGRLAEDMRRYALKRDGTRHGLASDEELRAAKLAAAFLGGRV